MIKPKNTCDIMTLQAPRIAATADGAWQDMRNAVHGDPSVEIDGTEIIFVDLDAIHSLFTGRRGFDDAGHHLTPRATAVGPQEIALKAGGFMDTTLCAFTPFSL